MKKFLCTIGLIIAALGLGTSCQSAVQTCGEGEEVELSEDSVCVYDEEIVIETGFSCPADKPFIHGGDGHFVCSEGKELTPDDISRINEELGQGEGFRTPEGGSIGSDDRGWGVSENQRAADVLFVIDDSSGMCEKQEAIAAELDVFVQNLDYAKVDLHIGVTSTHKTPEGLDARVFGSREYGALRSRPYPALGSSGPCRDALTFEGILERAVSCTKAPSVHRTKLTDEEAACVEDDDSASCRAYCQQNSDKAWCDGDTGEFDFQGFQHALLPSPEDYRSFPSVLKTSDYREADGSLRRSEFLDDFRCISMVGTRGWGIEKGLGAAVRAVSPEMTTGNDAPNAGFIRPDSRFGVVFMSDENDCTHDGGISETGAGECFNDVCAFENSTQLSEEESALIPLGELKSDLMSNLRNAKNRESFSEQDIFAAGIYGIPDRYDGPRYTREECAEDSYQPVAPTCESPKFGTAYSGDRYERFLAQFPNRLPTGDETFTGQMCLPNEIDETLTRLGNALGSWETATE